MNVTYTAHMPRPPKRPRPPQGAHLVRLRQAAGLTQAEVADALGETQQNVAKWEVSVRPPPSPHLPKLAAILGVTVEDILNVHSTRPVKSRPKSKLAQVVDEIGQLPRRQQERFVQMAAIFLEQERRRTG